MRWLLRFLEEPLGEGDDRDIEALGTALLEFVHPVAIRQTIPARLQHPSRVALQRWQGELRAALESLAHGEPIGIVTNMDQTWSVRIAGRRVVRQTELRFPQIAVFAVVELLDQVGADRLRKCQYREGEDEPICGRVFLASHRNERFHDRKEAARTAWRAWWKRQGGTRVKK